MTIGVVISNMILFLLIQFIKYSPPIWAPIQIELYLCIDALQEV